MPLSHPGDGRRDTTVLDGALLRRWPLPVDADGDKFSRGTVLVVGGSPTTPGAVVLAGMAALRMGAGRLQIATASPSSGQVAASVAEAMVLPLPIADDGALRAPPDRQLDGLIHSADAILVGPGMTNDPSLVGMIELVLRHAREAAITVLDAAALHALQCVDPALRRRLAERLVLTPNRQEVRRLLEGYAGELAASTSDGDLLAKTAQLNDAVVTSFGSVRTWDGRGWDVEIGHPSLGTSGSGDVLAGMVAGLAGRTGDPAQAACWATLAHAATGQSLGRRCGHLGFLARELIDEVGAVMCGVVGSSETRLSRADPGYPGADEGGSPMERGKAQIVVEPRPDGRWARQKNGATRAASLHDTQAEAEQAARAQARRERTEFVVKGRDGRIQRRDSFGNDPRSRPG